MGAMVNAKLRSLDRIPQAVDSLLPAPQGSWSGSQILWFSSPQERLC